MGQQRFTAGLRMGGVVVLAVAACVLGLAPASAAPRGGPAAVRQLVTSATHEAGQRHAATDSRHALRVPSSAGEDEDDQTYVDIAPGCVTGGGKAKPNAAVYSPTKVTLDYVLTGTGVHATGTVKVKAHRTASLGLKAVRAGSYRLTLAVHGTATEVGDESFDVRPCVEVTATCRAVTFRNPTGNAAAYVEYRGHKKNQFYDIALAPGTSRTVRADYSKIDYEAMTDDADGFALGRATLTVKQHCSHGVAQPGQNAVQTTAVVGCSATGPATVTLRWSVQPSVDEPRYEIVDAQQVPVRSGKPRGGHDADVALAAGRYTYRTYANGLDQPFEVVTFQVLGCVQLTPRCKAFDVTNPNDVPLAVLALTTDDDAGEQEELDPVTVGAGATVTIPWLDRGVWVLALPEGELDGVTAFLTLGSDLPSDDEPEGVAVPQDC